MCRTCGCDEHEHEHAHAHDHGHGHGHDHDHDHDHDHGRTIALETRLLARNDRLASELRERLVRARIVALNLIGAPGAGKTALLEATLRRLHDVPITVIEGDQATDHDAQRIAATGRPVIQVNTGAGCHLDATMIERGLAQLAPDARSLLFIENVGNLVCPALFDLGEHAKIVVMSVTEGEDKPLKYPHVFQAAAALVLTKTDLVPHLDVDVELIIANARKIQPELQVFPVSSRRGDGLGDWCGWLRAVRS
ncbi:MAG TPA: hydrogenase nickel incorporation protein HypB [Kofleriaceae bacterium]|jgi:hydrogenase nickel incorporation protein HypB